MSFKPLAHEIYRYFNGDLYQIIATAEHFETGECYVVYQALYGEYKTYILPLDQFGVKVDKEEYPEADQDFIFQLKEAAKTDQGGAEASLDPLILEFLEAESYENRLNILAGLHHRITDEMITTMAIACDIELEEEGLEERYEALRNCLVTLEKYECNR